MKNQNKKNKREMKTIAMKKMAEEGKAEEPYQVMAIRELMKNANN